MPGKKTFSLLLKIIVGIASFWFIYYKLEPQLSYENTEALKKGFSISSNQLLLGLCLLLMPLNWGIEIYKWQLITRGIEQVNYVKALRSVLCGLCLGNLTPGRIGEFAGRILFFKPSNRGAIAVTHFVCGLTQLMTTVSIGLLALLVLRENANDFDNYWIVLVACVMFFILLSLLVLRINSIYHWLSGRRFMRRFQLGGGQYAPRIMGQLMLLSLLRYMVFSSQYYILLYANGASGDVLQLYAAIAVSFMLMSSIPMISFIEVAIRGAIALLLFGSFGAGSLQLLLASTLLWLINIIIPSLFGYFIFVSRKSWNETKEETA